MPFGTIRRRLALVSVAAVAATLLPLAAASAVGVNLSFTAFPPNPAKAGSTFPVTVHVQDNAAAALAGVLVTLDIDPAHNPGADTLSCTSGTALATGGSGNAAFTGCRINKVGSGYQLRARASGATTVSTPNFDVEVGPAAALNFASYPGATTPALLTPQPIVQVVDAAGNVVTSDSRTITLSIDKNGGTFSCTGGLSKAAVNGTATFSGCQQTNPDTNYNLTANDGPGNLPAISGPNFTVVGGTATRLLICWGTANPCVTAPPASITGGRDFPTQPSVRVVDDAGNTVTSDDNTIVVLSILGGTPVAGGPGVLTCTNGLSKKVSDGVATFAGCKIDRTGTGYRLNAGSAPPLAGALTNPFNVVVGPPANLAFVGEPPTTVTAGQAFGSNIQVGIVDAGGNVVTIGIAATVRLSVGTNPGGATLTCAGGTDATTVNGIATFTGCAMNQPGAGYTLSARTVVTAPNTNLGNATSRTFTVVPTAANIAIATNPSNGVITWGGTVVLNVHFATNGAGKTFTLQVSRDNVNWSNLAVLVTNASGDAAFPYRPSDNRYYRAVFAGTPDLAAGSSLSARVVVRQTNALRPTNGGAEADIAAGRSVVFHSTVRPNRPELPQAQVNFVVYRLVGSAWLKIIDRTVGVDGAGVGTVAIQFSTAGRYYVRSQAAPTAFNANSGWSPVVRFEAH